MFVQTLYSECNYTEYCDYLFLIFSVVMLNVIMLSVIMLNVVILSVVMLNVVILSIAALKVF